MYKLSLTALAAALSLAAAAASATPADAVTYQYYNSNGALVGTKSVSCDGTETVSGEQTADEVETSSQPCTGAREGDSDPEVVNGPHP
ncbi:MAG: hypothetical protein JWP59_612 [Massilia sp.]|jgi:hypothetical protein|nr:hypothetical protein [Massilia sp.]